MEFTVVFSEVLRNYLIAIAAIIGLPLAIWRSYIAYKNSSIASKNHLTDTYTKAIEQIGHEDETCKLGGLYALEKIAYQNENYHHQIIEVICAFIRFRQVNHDKRGNRRETHPGGGITSVTIQAALDIIRRRNLKFERKTKLIINLAHTDLSNYSLEGASLQGAIFTCCDLNMSNFKGADLSHSEFNGINLQNIQLDNADLKRANLTGTALLNVDLSKVHNLTREQVDGVRVATHRMILPE